MEEVIFAAFGKGFRCPKCKHDILMKDEDGVEDLPNYR